MLSPLHEGTMNHVSFNDVFGHIHHEPSILRMPLGIEFSNSVNILTMEQNSLVNNAVSSFIPLLVLPCGNTLGYVVFDDVPFNPCELNRARALGQESLLEMIPQVAIRCGVPANPVGNTSSGIVKNLICPIDEGFAVAGQMHRAMTAYGKDAGSQLSTSRTASIAPNVSSKLHSITELINNSHVSLSRASLMVAELATRPPDPGTSKSEDASKWELPCPISVNINLHGAPSGTRPR